MRKHVLLFIAALALLLIGHSGSGYSQVSDNERRVDERVKAFLARMEGRWRDLNVPTEDGRILYETIVKNKYTKALEIGTSTGHSSVWIAWALSKTGGRLTTIEIDPDRHKQALAHFAEAGLSDRIDARLDDAHELVTRLSGPFDFVFIDADKEWYTDYARAVIPKLQTGGCIAAHNVTARGSGNRLWGRMGAGGSGDYYTFMRSQTDFETSISPDSRSGLALSYRKRTG